MSEVYDPTRHCTLAAARGEQARLYYPVNKLLLDMDRAGFITVVPGVNEPSDTSVIWLDLDGVELTNGIPKAYAGSWLPLTKALFLAHLGGGGPGLSDGDKGDITVSGSGAVWAIDADVISTFGRTLTAAASALAAKTVLGLAAIASTGSASDLTAGLLPAARFDDTSHGNRGGGTLHAAVTTSVDGFMSAADKTKLNGVATGANLYVHPNHTGDVTSVADGATTIANDAVTYAKMQNAAANSVLCRAAATSGDLGEVALSASQLFGRGATGDLAPIALGTNLSMTGTTLNAAGGGGGGSPGGSAGQVQFNSAGSFGGFTVGGDATLDTSTGTLTVANQAITPGKIQNFAANTVVTRAAATSGSVAGTALAASQLLGRGSTGDVAAITLGSGLSMTGTTLAASGSSGITRGQAVALQQQTYWR